MNKPYENEFKLELQLFGDEYEDEDEDVEDVEGDDELLDTAELDDVESEDEEIIEDKKLYSEEELNARLDELLPKKLARREAKIRREYEEKLAKLNNAETVLNAGLGTESIDDAIEELTEYYEAKGIKIPANSNSKYSERDEVIIGKADAQDIIQAGLDEVIEELDRLGVKGENRTPRERTIFLELYNHKKNVETAQAFKAMGVSEDVLKDESFKNFSSKFNPNVPATEILELFQKQIPKEKKKREVIGSMKTPPSNKVKDFYTSEEVDKLTLEDLSDPLVMAAVDRSMAKW